MAEAAPLDGEVCTYHADADTHHNHCTIISHDSLVYHLL